jgi:hypothetical protein
MKRLHVHLSVENLAESIRFYSALFAAEPTVSKPDYAKWMMDDPRVNFAISQRGAAVGLNHLGVQVASENELAEMHTRLRNLETGVTEETNAACCYAKSDKYWVNDPQGVAWETFHTLDSVPMFGEDLDGQTKDATCCVPLAKAAQKDASSCCSPTSKEMPAKGNCC